jgi:acetyl-CoA carboxylase biotin carboxyl carrier protein
LEPKEIRELIELVSRSDFSKFEMERDGFKIKLVKQSAKAPAIVTVSAIPQTTAAGAPIAAADVAVVATDAAAAAPVAEDGLVDLNSPIVGTFYRAPGPDSPPFVEVGAKVRKGQTLCIVEAMKVMNEIESEIDAEVVDAPLANGQPVEFGEVLFRLRPMN